MPSVYLLTGENSHELLTEKTRWIHEFSKKFGTENTGRMDGQKSSIREILDEVGVLPFLAEKRLVVIDGIPKASKEEIQALFSAIHPACIALFVDPKPDKRSGGVKELLASAEVRTFAPIDGMPLKQWIHQYAKERGATLEPSATEELLEYAGNDQSLIAREIEKLAAYRTGSAITKKDVELLCLPTEEGVVWKISDMLAAGSKNEALLYAHRLIDRGGDAYGLWAILTSMIKNLTAVYAASEAGYRSSKDIADATGVHPFAVRSLQKHANRLEQKRLYTFVSWTADADRALKTGEIRSTGEAPEELFALIDACILKCP